MLKTRPALGLLAAAITAVIVAFVGCTQSGTTPPPLIGINNPPPAGNPTPQLVVADPDFGDVVMFPVGLTGTQNVAPTTVIAGSHTQFSQPNRVARDGRGNIFVSDQGCNSDNGCILIFDFSATGNAFPAAVIAGSNFSTGCVVGVAVGADNSVFGTDFCNAKINIFGPLGPSGNIPPSATISGGNTQLGQPNTLALDASGNLWVTDDTVPSVLEFAAGATGNATPIKSIHGVLTTMSFPIGVAIDSSGNIFVADGTNDTILQWNSNRNGNTAPDKIWTNVNFSSPDGLRVDATYVYETNFNGASICWFPKSSATGAVTTTGCIVGGNTGLSQPAGLSL